jgi:hypothetical protein
MNVRYRVELSQAERDELTAMLGGGKHAARKLKRAPSGTSNSTRFVGELHLTGQMLAEEAHHSRAEGSPCWRRDRRTSPFRPNKAEPLLQLVYRPCGLYAACGADRAPGSIGA